MHLRVPNRFFKHVRELWSILFGAVDVSEAFGCCASDDSGTPWQPSQASLDKRFSSCRSHSSEVATAVFSCMCPAASATQSCLQNLVVPTKPLEILAGPSEQPTQMEERRNPKQLQKTRTVRTRHHVEAPCRRRARLRQVVGHLMICSSSATSASLLEHLSLRTVATRNFASKRWNTF